MRTLILVLASVSAFAQTKPAAQKSAFDKATLESYLRNVELWNPQVTVKIDDAKPSASMPDFLEVSVHASFNGAQKDEMYYVSKDGHKVLKGEIYDINRSPFQANLDKLKTTTQPSYGPANAPVTLVVFGDFQCPYCKEEGQVIRGNVEKTFKDKVRVVFEDFPLDSIHPWARPAAITGRCVYRQSPAAFWSFFDWAYDNQTQITTENLNERVQDFAKIKGLDGLQLGRCVDSKATELEVNASVARGRAVQVAATPTIFVNGRKMEGGLPWASLEQLIKIELDQATTAAAAKTDEACCEVKIPTLGK